jgi:tetratricopeptide (TPR) repeat protein
MSARRLPGPPAATACPRLPRPLLPLCLFLLPCLPGCLAFVDERVPQFTEDGVQLFQRREYQNARECFEAALELQPGDANLMYNVAQCYDCQGNTAKAEESYRLCLARSANHARCRHSLALLLYRTGEGKQADQMVQDWLAAEPQLPDALVEDGWRLRQGGHLHQAQARFQQALHQDPNHVRALTELGILYEQQLQPEVALCLYRRALDRDGKQPELLEHVRALTAKGVGRPLPD